MKTPNQPSHPIESSSNPLVINSGRNLDKAVLVARVSDVDQRQALPGQKQKLLAYANLKGYEFTYHEFDESAYKGDRKEFKKSILEPLLKTKEKIIVVFDKIDRFTRDSSGEERTLMKNLLLNDKIELHFPSDNLFIHKHSPAADTFRLDIGIALASYYSSAIRDNVKRRFDQKLTDGEWPGKAPIGYLNINIGKDARGKDVKDIAIDPERQELIKYAFEMRATGISYAVITKHLRKAGMTTTKAGKPVIKSHVEHFLKNPFYYGVMRYEDKLYSHKYPPIIQKWLWDKVEEVDKERTQVRSKSAAKSFLFKDFIKCGYCGYSVYCDGPKKGNIYLKCTEYGGRCGAIRLNEKLVTSQVLAILDSVKVPKEVIPQLVGDLRQEFETEQIYYQRQVKSLRSEYDKIDEEIKDMFRDRSKFKIRPELFDELMEEKGRRQADLMEQMKDHGKGNEQFVISASKILQVASTASELFMAQSTTLSQKRALIKFVLSNLKLEGEKLVFNLKAPFDAIAECSKNNSWLLRSGSNRRPIR
jgi:site-specific DNA recombinase